MRNGKIARLPHQIRDQLNSRLHDGQQAKTILDWLNPLPEVRAILAEHFGGRPVSAVNLTEWTNGGFRDWLVRQEALDFVQNLQDQHALGDESLTEPFPDKLAHWAALQYAASAHALVVAEQDPAARWSHLRQFCADVSRLRRSDLLAERFLIERERLEMEQHQLDQEEIKEMKDRSDGYARLASFLQQALNRYPPSKDSNVTHTASSPPAGKRKRRKKSARQFSAPHKQPTAAAKTDAESASVSS